MTIERGSDKHGARTDDALAGEVEGAMRGGHSTHAEEWKDPEPSGEDQPDVDLVPDGTLTGGTPEGVDSGDVEGRSELASYLGKEVYPATADALRAAAEGNQAPDRVLEQLASLPAGRTYDNVQQVWEDLGGGREQRF
jgi:Protein of unknown function (DUF2795)